MTKAITRIAMVAVLYAVTTMLLYPISYGPVQVRLSEALTLLPYYFGSWAAVGLWVGCLVANFVGGLGVLDLTLGAGLTLLAGLLTARASNLYLAAIPPVILNAIGIGWMVSYLFGLPLLASMVYIGIGQFVAVFIVGIPLMKWLVPRLAGRLGLTVRR